jgi:hypothetical protein
MQEFSQSKHNGRRYPLTVRGERHRKRGQLGMARPQRPLDLYPDGAAVQILLSDCTRSPLGQGLTGEVERP